MPFEILTELKDGEIRQIANNASKLREILLYGTCPRDGTKVYFSPELTEEIIKMAQGASFKPEYILFDSSPLFYFDLEYLKGKIIAIDKQTEEELFIRYKNLTREGNVFSEEYLLYCYSKDKEEFLRMLKHCEVIRKILKIGGKATLLRKIIGYKMNIEIQCSDV